MEIACGLSGVRRHVAAFTAGTGSPTPQTFSLNNKLADYFALQGIAVFVFDTRACAGCLIVGQAHIHGIDIH